MLPSTDALKWVEEIHLGIPDPTKVQQNLIADDVRAAYDYYIEAAKSATNLRYFFIYANHTPVGLIALHDIDEEQHESLVAYHIFYKHLRHKGIGTKALGQLLAYVQRETTLSKLFIITSDDNIASQSLAKKCGFRYVGASREDPIHGMVFAWERPCTCGTETPPRAT